MLMGEYRHNIDEKNRLVIPSKFREALGNNFVVTRGIEKCLFVYPMNEWDKITNKLASLPFTKSDARKFTRFFLSAAEEKELDKSGRVGLSNAHLEYANINRECVIIGTNDRVEIWSLESWTNFLSENEDSLSDIAENLFEGDSYAL